jgi:hypothetical protein
MPDTDTTNALTTIIKALTPLKSNERHRIVDAAMLFLGETSVSTERGAEAADAQKEVGDGNYPAGARTWMKQNGVSAEELDMVFHFGSDGTFDIHDAPGKSKKEKTLNTYILTGLGRYLTTSERGFEDSLARGFCETIGCYDPANHAAHLKDKGAEFSGDKSKGYTLTNVGVKRGAALVKEVAGAAK